MQTTTSLKPWGNSLGIRIPRKILEGTSIKQGDTLNITASEDTIIIKKTFKHKTFEERLAEYDGEISVIDYDWGEPAGREMF